jgi:hypothetical protein
MAARYRNYIEYDKRDYNYTGKPVELFGGDDEEPPQVCEEETTKWNDVSMAVFEFLRDKVEEMAVPILDHPFGLFDVIQLFSMHAKKE